MITVVFPRSPIDVHAQIPPSPSYLSATVAKIPTIRNLDTQLAHGVACPTPRAWCSYTRNSQILPSDDGHHVPGQKNVPLDYAGVRMASCGSPPSTRQHLSQTPSWRARCVLRCPLRPMPPCLQGSFP